MDMVSILMSAKKGMLMSLFDVQTHICLICETSGLSHKDPEMCKVSTRICFEKKENLETTELTSSNKCPKQWEITRIVWQIRNNLYQADHVVHMFRLLG